MGRKQRITLILAVILLSGAFSLQIGWEFLFHRDSYVTFVNEGRSEEGYASEVWLQIEENGVPQNAEDIFLPEEDSGWTILNGRFLSITPGAALTIPCKVPNNVTFVFNSHAYTGKVTIIWEENSTQYDFFSTENTKVFIDAPWLTMTAAEIDWLSLLVLTLLSFTIGIVLYWILCRFPDFRWQIMYGLVWLLGTSIIGRANRLDGSFACLFFVCASIALLVVTRMNKPEKNLKGLCLASGILIDIITTFLLFGNCLFWSPCNLSINLYSVSLAIAMAGTFFPVVYFLFDIPKWFATEIEEIFRKNIFRLHDLAALIKDTVGILHARLNEVIAGRAKGLSRNQQRLLLTAMAALFMASWGLFFSVGFSSKMSIAVTVALFLVGLCLFAFLCRWPKFRWQILHGICWLQSLATAWRVNRIDSLFVGILLLCLFAILWLSLFPSLIKKYWQGGKFAAVAVLGFYISFALTGNYLFLLDTRMTVNLYSVSLFIILTGMLFPLAYLAIGLLEWLLHTAGKWTPVENTVQIQKIKWKCFRLTSILAIIISFAFYPANVESDGINHWLMAVGERPLSNGHPVAHTLFVRFLSKIWKTPYVYTLFQIFLYAWIISKWLAFLFEKGCSEKVVKRIAIAAAILPSNYMMYTLLSKNPLFSYLNLWLLMQLVYLLDRPEKCASDIIWCVQTAICLASLYLVRYNDFLLVISAAVILIILSVRFPAKLQWTVQSALLGMFFLIFFIQGPVYDRYDYAQASSASSLGPLFSPLTGVLQNELEIPEYARDKMESVLSLEEWKERYNPYNRDIITWREPRPNYSNITTAQGLRVYLTTFWQYPDIVIKDRLNGTDIIWNVFQPEDPNGVNTARTAGVHHSMSQEYLPLYLQGIEPNQVGHGFYVAQNTYYNILCWFSDVTSWIGWLDVLFWRNGLYLIFVFASLIVFFQKNKRNILLIIPSLANMITLLLVLGWQIYDYIYFFPLATILYITCGSVMQKRNNSPQEIDVQKLSDTVKS